METCNKKWSIDLFLKFREEVLNQWSTGQEVPNIEDNVQYLKKIPTHKSFSTILKKADESKQTLIQPRSGVSGLEAQYKLLKYLQDEGKADLLTLTVDSYTRQNRYKECDDLILESNKVNRSLLNGFPIVNHGVKATKNLFERVNRPLQVRHGTPDARLLSEISHASGCTSNEGGPICYNIPYAKNVSLEKSIRDWQYCDRLVGIYQELDVELNREFFAPLTATLVPPCISNAIMIIEAILAAEQGVKNMTVGYGQGGHLIQDIAAIQALKEQTSGYLKDYGYNVNLTTVFHQWMGGFPSEESKAFGVISLGSIVATLSKVTKVIVKTPQEAFGVPTKEANLAGLEVTRQLTQMLQTQIMPSSKELNKEVELIKAETKCILDKVLELGKGDWAIGTVLAFKSGVLDVPFAPSIYTKKKILPVRDLSGAIRIFDFGDIPISREIKNYHSELIYQRSKKN